MQCVIVATLTSGEIDCADLKASLLAHKDKPAIINLNIGIISTQQYDHQLVKELNIVHYLNLLICCHIINNPHLYVSRVCVS